MKSLDDLKAWATGDTSYMVIASEVRKMMLILINEIETLKENSKHLKSKQTENVELSRTHDSFEYGG